MKSIAIEPNQLLKIKKIQIFLGISIVLLLSGFILFSVYVAKIKSMVTQSGEKIYLPNSKIPLYISISFFGISLITTFLSLSTYEKIFKNFASKTRNWLFVLIAVTLIGIILDIIFIVKKFNFCPPNKEYSENLNRCVDICPLGSYPNDIGSCTSGCVEDDNCADTDICLSGTCCNLETHTNVNETCCPNDNVQTVNGTEYCCQKICDKQCCIGDKSLFDCSEDGKQCVSKCGDITCEADETCLIYPDFASDNPTDKIYKCYKESECNPDTGPQNYPYSIKNFYPAYNGGQNTCDDTYIQKFLDTTNYDDGKKQIQCVEDGQDNNGFICGIPNNTTAIRFQQKMYTPKNSDQACTNYEKCMSEVHYPQTTHLQINESDDGLICNQILNVNKTSNVQYALTDGDASYQKINQLKTDKLVKFEKTSTNFCPEGQILVDGKCKDDDNLTKSKVQLCSSEKKYSPDCNKFKDCTGTECPFEVDVDDPQYVCPKMDGTKFIQGTPASQEKCTIDDGSYGCTIIKEDEYDKYKEYQNCKNATDCDSTRNSFNRNYDNVSKNCITGEGSWSTNQPKSGITQMKYDNYGGGYATGGNCNLKTEVKDKIGIDFPCPRGTKPYFWARKKDTRGEKDCGNYHNAYYSRMDYACCDDNKFTLTDNDKGNNAPENKKYCIGPKNGAASNDNHFSLTSKETINNSSSTVIGRGSDKDPVSSTNSCNVSAEKGLVKLKNLMNHMNREIW